MENKSEIHLTVHTVEQSASKKNRHTFTDEERRVLESEWDAGLTSVTDIKRIEDLAHSLNLTIPQIKSWIGNKRQKKMYSIQQPAVSSSTSKPVPMQLKEPGGYKNGEDSYLDERWRKSPALNNVLFDQLKEQIENHKPVPSLSLSQVRVLLLGPVGAGKSSFINTINSIFRERISNQAGSGSSDHSLTNVYRQYQVRSGTAGEPLSFRLCDTRGLEEGEGLDVMEVKYLLEGHVPDFYEFRPSSITPDVLGFNKSPALKDKIHCVAFVIDGSAIDFIPKPILEKIKNMKTQMNQRGIPQAIILTKVDIVSKVVAADISDVFKSEAVLEAVEKVSQMFGVPRGNVLPVKNYENEVCLDDQISALALLALRQILGYADDFLYNYLDKLECENVQKLNIKE